MIRMLAVVLLIAANPALAQDKYPSRPVRVVVPFAPGGGVDMTARSVAAKLTERLSQQFIVDNRPGAGGSVAIDLARKAAPDGYTLLAISSSYAANASLHKLTYDPVNAFAPITLISQQPLVLSVNPALPVANVKELIAFAKAKPGALSYATSGAGGIQHLGTELFRVMAGIDIVHVPYKGTAPALQDVVAGQVQMQIGAILATLPLVKAGRLKALAVTSLKRSEAAPNLPTIDESALPGYSCVGWYAMLAPAHTPQAIVALLNREIVQSLQGPDMKDRLATEGSTVVGSTPDALYTHMRDEIAKWRKVVAQANIRLDGSK
jgi:tripartite-type tricarboxylate transporter receptor subunit TctC